MTDVNAPMVGTVTFYNGTEGHGIAATTLGTMTFKIPFRMADREEVTLIDDLFVLGGSPKDQHRRIDIKETLIAMVVVLTDTGKPRANAWGILPKSYLDDGRPVVVAPTHKSARKRHKKKPKEA